MKSDCLKSFLKHQGDSLVAKINDKILRSWRTLRLHSCRRKLLTCRCSSWLLMLKRSCSVAIRPGTLQERILCGLQVAMLLSRRTRDVTEHEEACLRSSLLLPLLYSLSEISQDKSLYDKCDRGPRKEQHQVLQTSRLSIVLRYKEAPEQLRNELEGPLTQL